MGFEVPPTRVVSKRTRWSAVPVVALAMAIVAAGVVAKTGQAPAPDLPAPTFPAPTPPGIGTSAASVAPSASADTVADVPSPPGDDGTAAVRLPSRLECSSIDRSSCVAIASAAIRILPRNWPGVQKASVWRSLLCDNSIDCPPLLLKAVVPLGSAILDLADGGPPIWVNVVGWRTLEASSAGLHLQAWIVRS